jgi:hypothetical protein
MCVEWLERGLGGCSGFYGFCLRRGVGHGLDGLDTDRTDFWVRSEMERGLGGYLGFCGFCLLRKLYVSVNLL